MAEAVEDSRQQNGSRNVPIAGNRKLNNCRSDFFGTKNGFDAMEDLIMIVEQVTHGDPVKFGDKNELVPDAKHFFDTGNITIGNI